MQTPKELSDYFSRAATIPFQRVTDRNGTNFSVHLGKPDPQDRKYDLLKNIIDTPAKGEVPRTKDGLVPIADDEYYQYISRKVDAELEANFEGWVMNQVDFSSPEKMAHWSRIAPFVQEKREAVLEEQAALQKRLALIKLRGPSSEDDLKLLYALHTKLIDVADVPLYKLDEAGVKFKGSKTGPSESFTAGIFSPWKSYFHNKDSKTALVASGTVGVLNWNDPLGNLGTGKTAIGAMGEPTFKIA